MQLCCKSQKEENEIVVVDFADCWDACVEQVRGNLKILRNVILKMIHNTLKINKKMKRLFKITILKRVLQSKVKEKASAMEVELFFILKLLIIK